MRAVVVGGGLSGCVAALQLRDAGADVRLYELHDYLGGVVKDAVIGGDAFFNSCQYLRDGEPWLEPLRTRVDLDLIEFGHTYASVTEMNGQRISHGDFPGPVFRDAVGAPALGSLDEPCADEDSVAHRFGRYPPHVAHALTGWFKGFQQDPQRLHHLCTAAAQCSRIYLQGDEERIAALKRGFRGADEILGLPRSIRSAGAPLPQALLPREGYDPFFDTLGRFLAGRGIDVHLRAPVKPAYDEEHGIRLSSRSSEVPADVIVWACNPVPLLMCLGLGRLDNPVVPMRVRFYHASFEFGPVAPFYIQTFSESSPITRIFAYHIGGRQCVTVEAFSSDRYDDTAVTVQAKRFLGDCGYPVSLDYRGQIQQKRHVFFTVEDYQRLKSFNAFGWDGRPGPAVIGGAWHVYGRNQKIARIDAGIRSYLSRWRGG